MLPVRQKLKFANCVLFGFVFVSGAANTGVDPTATLSGLRSVQSIGRVGDPIPGNAGIPAVNVASKMNEFPVVFPTASETERVGPEPPGSSGFFQM